PPRDLPSFPTRRSSDLSARYKTRIGVSTTKGTKRGVPEVVVDRALLAVMERGAVRFFSSLRLPQERIGTPEEHLAASVEIASDADRKSTRLNSSHVSIS